MSDHAKLLRMLNIKLQTRTAAIGGSDPILAVAARRLADAAEHIDQLIRQRDEARKNVMDMENATACVPEDLSVDEYVKRLQAESERLRALEVRECENGNVDEFVGWVHIERMDERSLCLTAYGGVVYDLIAENDGSLTIYCVDKGRAASKEQES